ncbi:MAG TPA: hypothetical protein VHZ95_19665, partial [Polyangiales bacterium]|nr:hypothetical protein [Polyangiales bacterium]
MPFRSWLLTALAACVFAVTPAFAEPALSRGAVDTLRQVAGILDYIAGDYRGAVAPDGSLKSASEYSEQRALANDAAALTAGVGLADGDPLRTSLRDLTDALSAKRDPEQVEQLCRRARDAIVKTHNVD